MSDSPAASRRRDLYALLVGIDRYPHVRPLQGCVGDARNMVGYLSESFIADEFNLHLVTLLDDQASKSAIVHGFRNHLGRAGADDVAFFFFAGHGAREDTTVPAFAQAELDGKIGNILCWDSAIPQAPGGTEQTCLSDKELRFLIHELSATGASTVTVFDCCHSGDNTRGALDGDETGVVRQVTRDALKARGWEGFLFHDRVDPALLDNSTALDVVLPQGRHIQLAACRDVEQAYEDAGQGGRFTRALIETLRSHKGRIRYHDLYGRVKNRMVMAGKKAQTPQVYVQTGNPADRHLLFLTNQPDDQPAFASVTYNQSLDHWRMDLGALHGIPPDPTVSGVTVNIYPKGQPDDGTRARITSVGAGYSVVDASPATLDPAATYRAEIDGLAIRPLDVCVRGDADGVELVRSGLARQVDAADVKYLRLVNDEADADYLLIARDGELITTRPGFAVPILQEIQYRDDAGGARAQSAIDTAYRYLVQIGKWTFLRDMEHRPPFPEAGNDHAAAAPGRFPVELKIIQQVFDAAGSEVERERHQHNGTVSIELTHDKATGKAFSGATQYKDGRALIRMELTNRSSKELYCTLFYLSQEFGVQCPFFEQDELALMPGGVTQSRKTRSGDYLRFRVSDDIRQGNWDGHHEYVKLVVSEEPFGADALKMDALPEPGSASRRAALDDDDDGEDLPPYWSTYTVELFVRNPAFEAHAAQ